MKLRLAVAVLLLSAAVICAALSYAYLNEKSRLLIGGIETALNARDETTLDALLAVCNMWEDCEPLFCVLIHHDDADDLIRSFFELRKSMQAEDAAGIRAALNDCLLDLKVLMEGEKLKFTNFL